MALLGEHSGETFRASSLAFWFHHSPHRDFELDDTTTIFTPSDESYNEALILLAIFISSFGALLFVAFILYYTCCFWRCCKGVNSLSDDAYQRRRSRLRTFIVILGVICCGAVIMGYVCNGRASDGVDQFRNAVDDIQTAITDAISVSNTAGRSLLDARNNIRILKGKKLPDAEEAFNLTSQILDRLDILNKLLPQDVVNNSCDCGDKVHHYDNYRWLVTVSLLTWCVILCIFSFWIRCQTTVCIMLIHTLLALLVVPLVWAAMGADFGIATGVGDFCVNPAASIKTTEAGKIKSVVVDYYMNCANPSPFSRTLTALNRTLESVYQHIRDIPGYDSLTREILQELDDFTTNLSLYRLDIACANIHEKYMNGMDGLCNKGLDGLALVILSFLIIGLISGLMTCSVCPLWKYRKSYHGQIAPDVPADARGSGNPVLWWPTGVDFSPGEDQDHPLRTEVTADNADNERAPLITNQNPPNYDTANHSNVNYIWPNMEHNVRSPQMYGQASSDGHSRTPDGPDSHRHSF